MTTQPQHRRTLTRASRTDGSVTDIDRPSESSSRPFSTHEAIARRAYELYLERGGDHGHDQEDWFRAVQELGQDSPRHVVDDVAPDTSAQAIM